jgi:DnaJ-class molecular chaperone
MNHRQSCQELNLRPGAGEREIKAAFRQLARENHPDSAPDGGDSRRFQKVHEAYQVLLARAMAHHREEARRLGGHPWQFVSRSQSGLDIIYELALVRSEEPFELVIPHSVFEECPHCSGLGQILAPIGQSGSLLRPAACPDCGGSGQKAGESRLAVKVTAEMIRSGRIRLKGAGALESRTGRRGDLYISLNFVDRLAGSH